MSVIKAGWLKNPVLQFVLLGAGVFWLHGQVQQAERAAQPDTIIIEDRYVQGLVEEVEATAMREVTPEQRRQLVDKAITKEVLFREALSRNMDRGDAIIRRHLIQKMEFLLEARSEPETPSPEALVSWWEQHKDRYQRPARVSFSQVFFAPESEKMARFQKALDNGTPDPATAHEQGDHFLRGHRFDNERVSALPRVFGPEILEHINAENTGQWVGPVTTVYGNHFIYIDNFDPARTKNYDEAYSRVYSDLMEHRQERRKQQAIDELRQKYRVISGADQAVVVN